MLGKIYEQKGWKGKALEQYNKSVIAGIVRQSRRKKEDFNENLEYYILLKN